MELSARDGLCKVCVKVVTARQHALECDGCGRWVHRLCGTGITYTQYRGIMENIRRGGSFAWRCQSCEDDVRQQASNKERDAHVPDDMQNMTMLNFGAPALESTRIDAPNHR